MSDGVHVPHNEELLHELEHSAHKKGSRFQTTLLIFAALGTTIGGVLAAWEIYERITHREIQDKRIELDGGASIEVPKDWSLLNKDAMQAAMTRGGMDAANMFQATDRLRCFEFFGPGEEAPADLPTVVAFVFGDKFSDDTDLDALERLVKERPDCVLCKRAQLENGEALHAVLNQQRLLPDQSALPVTMDMYVFVDGRDFFCVAFIVEDAAYVSHAARFEKIAASLRW